MFIIYYLFSLSSYWSYLIILTNLAVLLALYYYCSSTHSLWESLGVPYIRPVPLFGSYFHLVFGHEHKVDLYQRIYQQLAGHKYGGFFQMRTPYLMIRDPELIKTILVKDFADFSDRGVHTEFSINPLSRSLFFTSSREWRVMRQKLSPTFTSGKLKLMYNQIRVCSDQFLNNLRETLQETDEIDFKDTFSKYTTDVIGTCFFGLKMNAISYKNSAFHYYGRTIFKPSIRMLIREFCLMINPALLKVFKITDFPSDAVQFFQSTFRDTIKHREENNIVRNDFIQILMQVRKDLVLNESLPPNEKFTESHIDSNAFIMFAAGFETLSTSISLCLYELSMKKHIQDRAREEIKCKLSKHGGTISNDLLFELNYLDMILEDFIVNMTTAARPTFEPARGGTGRGENDLSALSVQYSSRDLPSHTKLKYREPGQGTTEELQKQDFAKVLEEKEKGVTKSISGGEPPLKKIRPEHVPIATLDVDDPLDLDASDDDDSDDDAEELMLELQKIKKERMAEEARMDAEKREAEEQIRIQNILQGNPLLSYGPGAAAPKVNQKVKRRWNDDVVFKNCARTEPEKSTTFINDCIRSDFHRKFMDKYIK